MEKCYWEIILECKVVFQLEQCFGYYNFKMYFRNGFEFYYLDGKVIVFLDGNFQIVEGKYIVYIDFGMVKISFNLEIGKIYWVFFKEEQFN